MSRHDVTKIRDTPEPSTVLVEALLHVALLDAFCDTWMPIDDYCSIIHASFDLPRTTKILLTGNLLKEHLSRDALTKSCVDSRQPNTTGIFRDWLCLQNGTGKRSYYLCLCKPGSTPSAPKDGYRWSDDLNSLPPNWIPDRCVMRTILGAEEFGRLQEKLTEFLRPLGAQDKKRQIKETSETDTQEAFDSSSKRHRATSKMSSMYSIISIENPDGTTVLFNVPPAYARRLADMMTEHQDIAVPTKQVKETHVPTKQVIETHTATAVEISERICVDNGTDATENVPDQNVEIVSAEKERNISAEKERNNKVTDHLVTFNGNMHRVMGVPDVFELIHKTRHTVLKKKSMELANVKKCLDKNKFQGTELAKRIYAAAIVLTPGLSLTGAETLIPMVIAAFMADTQGSLDLSELPRMTKSFPSGSSLREFLYLYAIDCLLELSEALEKADCVYLACDKGNKKGLGHFVKVLSWWDKKTGKVKMFTLDVDASEGMTADCALAIQHSLKK